MTANSWQRIRLILHHKPEITPIRGIISQKHPVMINSQYYFATTPVYTSRRVERVAVGRREYLMSYGDHISVRMATPEGETIEYETQRVADMTDLIGDLRRKAKGMRGLAVVTVRNRDRGWTRERRIMLYPERVYAPAQRVATARMAMPWEH